MVPESQQDWSVGDEQVYFCQPSPQTEGACPDCLAATNQAFSETLDVLDSAGGAFTWAYCEKSAAVRRRPIARGIDCLTATHVPLSDLLADGVASNAITAVMMMVMVMAYRGRLPFEVFLSTPRAK